MKPKHELDIEIAPELYPELLTPSELRMIKQRLLIARLLKEGKSIRDVAHRIGVGTDTVMRMSRKIKSSKVLQEIFQKESKKKSSQWIFGETADD